MNKLKFQNRVALTMLAMTLAFSGISGAPASPLPTHKTNDTDFFYAQQTSLWVFFKAPRDVIQRHIGDALDNLGFEIASFEDKSSGYLIVKPMVFMAEFGNQTAQIPGTSMSTEVELTVLVQPKTSPAKTTGTFADFLQGKIKATRIGQLRLDVLCDQEVAVAAGRKNFGEHKFLGSFEYSYPTPNNQRGSTPPFSMDMSAYTWQGAGRADRKMFRIRANLQGLKAANSSFSPELLYSSFPPEPEAGVTQKAVGEHRYYDNKNFQAFSASLTESQVELSFGEALGAEALKPVAPFGDGLAIAGSERWPGDMVARMRGMLLSENVVGYLLFRSPPAEYETRPFEVK